MFLFLFRQNKVAHCWPRERLLPPRGGLLEDIIWGIKIIMDEASKRTRWFFVKVIFLRKRGIMTYQIYSETLYPPNKEGVKSNTFWGCSWGHHLLVASFWGHDHCKRPPSVAGRYVGLFSSRKKESPTSFHCYFFTYYMSEIQMIFFSGAHCGYESQFSFDDIWLR